MAIPQVNWEAAETDVVVVGRANGDIRIAGVVRVEEGAVVHGNVEANRLIVSGEVVGDCRATIAVELRSTARVTGRITAPKIVISEDASVRGDFQGAVVRETPAARRTP
jgi:cytoskeletal protein CcmA (bactofilin family)